MLIILPVDILSLYFPPSKTNIKQILINSSSACYTEVIKEETTG